MDFSLMKNNKVFIAGQVVSEPKFSHQVYDEDFYEFDLKVTRLSDTYDVIPVTMGEKLFKSHGVKLGDKISGNGQFRSYNKIEEDKSKLILTVFIRELVPYDESENANNIEIIGYVCKEPVFRVTPFKREICDVLLAVNRTYNKSDYLPCIAWGKNARFVNELNVGDKVSVIGRIQSRQYQKKINDKIITRVAYEVSLSRVELLQDEQVMDTVNTSIGKLENYYVR